MGWEKTKIFLRICKILLIIFIFSHGTLAGIGFCDDTTGETSRISVVLSHRIVPYTQALKGFKQFFSEKKTTDISSYFLYHNKQNQSKKLTRIFEKKEFDLIVGVGPDAAFFIQSLPDHITAPRIYSMVFSTPDNKSSLPVCGVGLSIPPEEKLYKISRIMPQVKKLGVLYNRQNITMDFTGFQKSGAALGLQFYPLQADQTDDIPGLLDRNRQIDALLLIPDQMIVTKSIIKYIILKSFNMDIPVIGFNQYFFKTGAVMSFVINYDQTGYKTGKLAQSIMSRKTCSPLPPEYQILLNLNAAQSLNLHLDVNPDFKIETQP